ncbi:hypothetical protein D083_3420 [Dickeya solani RNS 08.23.3.1.A]|nr:hypothetical protein D083_3420 [Dickeya solani RNS 08.23.3.1.A]
MEVQCALLQLFIHSLLPCLIALWVGWRVTQCIVSVIF